MLHSTGGRGSTPAPHRVTPSSTTFSTTLVAKDFYWRVRASSGELIGPYSAVAQFRVPLEPLRAPALLTPTEGAIWPTTPYLTVERLAHVTNRLEETWSYDFEIARDEAFAAMVVSARVGESVGVNSYHPPELAAGRYFWRVNAHDDHGHVSEYSPTRSFEVSAPFAATPGAVAPAIGATINQYAQFIVRTDRIYEGQAGTRSVIELSTTPDFASVSATAVNWAIREQTTTITFAQQLAGGTYYWRARNVLLKVPWQAEIASAWTTPRMVVLAGQTLSAPVIVAPLHNATTPLRPTFTVSNAARTVTGTSLAYRFEISTDAMFAVAPVIAGTVAEGSGTTSWTTPFDMPVGTLLWWRAKAVETATGAESPQSPAALFSAVDSKTQLYAFSLSVPPSCGLSNSTPQYFVQAAATPGASGLRFVARDAAPSVNENMVVTLLVGADGSVSGTVSGGASSGSFLYQFLGPGTSTTATLTGTAGVNMSGTFNGRVMEQLVPSPATTCAATPITWTLSPRLQ